MTPSGLEYWKISQFYGFRRARRSGVLYMDHIHEAVRILQHLEVSPHAINAFYLHPLFQNDTELLYFDPSGHDPEVIMRAMEYRHIANAYLPHDVQRVPKLSIFEEVNQMLIADKVHNRWQFEKHLRDKIENSRRLDTYFKDWLFALGVGEDYYHELIELLNNPIPEGE